MSVFFHHRALVIYGLSLSILGCGSDETSEGGPRGTTLKINRGTNTVPTPPDDDDNNSATPTGLQVSAVSAKCEEVDLVWTDPQNLSGYRVDRKLPGATSYKVMIETTSRFFKDSAATSAGSISYRVRPANTEDWVYKSIDVQACTGPASPTNTISNLQIVATASSEACMEVSVTYSIPGSTSVKVLRKFGAGGEYGAVDVKALPSGSIVQVLPAGSTGFVNYHTESRLGKTVHYRLEPQNSDIPAATISMKLPASCPN